MSEKFVSSSMMLFDMIVPKRVFVDLWASISSMPPRYGTVFDMRTEILSLQNKGL